MIVRDVWNREAEIALGTGTRGRDGSAAEDCQGVALSGLARDELTAFDLCTLRES
jgi:hypothetical protein